MSEQTDLRAYTRKRPWSNCEKRISETKQYAVEKAGDTRTTQWEKCP